MKSAQAADVWRKALKRPFKATYRRVEYTGIQKLGQGSIPFDAGITAIVGGNGVGKSTVMGALLRSMGPISEEHVARALAHTDAATIAGTVSADLNQEIGTALDGAGIKVVPAGAVLPPYEWIDPSMYATGIRRLLLADQNFQENLQGIDAQELGEDERNHISYVIGRTYESISVYEIDAYAEHPIVPYFKVLVEGVAYDSFGMGLGELSLLLIYWRLRRLADPTIVFIEEPETHISPRAQEHMMDVCMEMALSKGLSFVVTTHSPFVIAKVPYDRIRLLTRNGANVHVNVNPSHDHIARVLGDRITYHGALLVEDDFARCFVRSLLRTLAPDLIEYFEVAIAGANSDVEKGLSSLPPLKSWFSLVGVFDGDQRGVYEKKKYRWPHTFLPTEKSPESILRELITKERGEALKSLGCTEAAMNTACEAAGGNESHEWMRVFRQTLALDIQTLSDRLVPLWLVRQENQESCADLVTTLRKLAFLVRQD